MSAEKPKVSNSAAEKELDKAAKQFDAFEESLQKMTVDRMNAAPKEENEPQTKLSSREIAKNNELHLKPQRSIEPSPHPKTGAFEKFNEKFRDEFNFKMEEVNFIAENKEIGGEAIEIWTRPYGGYPAEFWKVPVNKPVWGPRHLAEKIKKCTYHRLIMDTRQASSIDGMGTYFESMAVDNTINRLDAHPVSQRQSIFMGNVSF